MKSHNVISGSLDMLLDTMCNTFGGVCFIALLVAVISVSLPPDRSGDADAASYSAEDPRVAQLLRQRNRLSAAVEALSAQLASMTNAPRQDAKADIDARRDAAERRAATADRDNARRRGDAASATDVAKAKTERANKLEALIAELEAEIKNPKYRRTRIIRLPHERQLSGYKTRNILLFNGCLYDLEDSSDVSISETRNTITYTVRDGGGSYVSDGFVDGTVWRRILDQTTSHTIIRIITDSSSERALTMLVQDVASRRRPYNWEYNDAGGSVTFGYGAGNYAQ